MKSVVTITVTVAVVITAVTLILWLGFQRQARPSGPQRVAPAEATDGSQDDLTDSAHQDRQIHAPGETEESRPSEEELESRAAEILVRFADLSTDAGAESLVESLARLGPAGRRRGAEVLVQRLKEDPGRRALNVLELLGPTEAEIAGPLLEWASPPERLFYRGEVVAVFLVQERESADRAAVILSRLTWSDFHAEPSFDIRFVLLSILNKLGTTRPSAAREFLRELLLESVAAQSPVGNHEAVVLREAVAALSAYDDEVAAEIEGLILHSPQVQHELLAGAVLVAIDRDPDGPLGKRMRSWVLDLLDPDTLRDSPYAVQALQVAGRLGDEGVERLVGLDLAPADDQVYQAWMKGLSRLVQETKDARGIDQVFEIATGESYPAGEADPAGYARIALVEALYASDDSACVQWLEDVLDSPPEPADAMALVAARLPLEFWVSRREELEQLRDRMARLEPYGSALTARRLADILLKKIEQQKREAESAEAFDALLHSGAEGIELALDRLNERFEGSSRWKRGEVRHKARMIASAKQVPAEPILDAVLAPRRISPEMRVALLEGLVARMTESIDVEMRRVFLQPAVSPGLVEGVEDSYWRLLAELAIFHPLGSELCLEAIEAWMEHWTYPDERLLLLQRYCELRQQADETQGR